MTAANQVVSLGLKDVGYEYINSKLLFPNIICIYPQKLTSYIVDDCWSVKSGRDNVTSRIIPDPVKFPDGIAVIASQIHNLGLKVGIYSSAGTKTCAGYPASIGNEYLDASTFASWGIDYVKYDNCYAPANWTDRYIACVPDSTNDHDFPNGTCAVTNKTAPADYDWSMSNTAERYRIMRDALLAQNRTILYSLCDGGQARVEVWGNATGHSWRMSDDITPYWYRIAEIMNENSFLLNSVDFWGHNDADMLEIGNGNLTLAESRSHFAFWAAMKSPLIIGTALDRLPADHVAILKNKHLLAFNQDVVYGKPAMPYKWGLNPNWTFNGSYPAEYWSGKSQNGILLLMLNSLAHDATREAKWIEIPQLKDRADDHEAAYQVTDVWTGNDLGCVEVGVSRTLESHDTAAFLVGKKCKSRKPGGWRAYWIN
jgi:alpha-galactosidase